MASRITKERFISFSTTSFVYILFVLLGISSWIAVNGVFTELPILFATSPEQYGIASDLALALQVANIVPVSYFLLNLIANPTKKVKYHMDSIMIFVLLVVGIASLAVLAGVWNLTFPISAGASPKSWPLLLMMFLLGIVDCTTTLTYWPFVSNFGGIYFIALSVGESATSLLSGIIGLIQQPGHAPLFSFSVFCIILIVFTIISMVAFLLLRFLPIARRQMIPWDQPSSQEHPAETSQSIPAQQDSIQEGIRNSDGDVDSSVSASSAGTGESTAQLEPAAVADVSMTEQQPASPVTQPTRLARARKALINALRGKQFAIILRLFVIMGSISFFENGLLVTAHPYSIKSYPQTESLQRYQILIGQILAPLAVFLAHIPFRGWFLELLLFVLHGAWIVLSVLAIVFSCLNPVPPAKDSLAMGIVMVVLNIACKITLSFVKALEWKTAQQRLQKVKAEQKKPAPEEQQKDKIEPSDFVAMQSTEKGKSTSVPHKSVRDGRWDPFRFAGLSIQLGSLLGSIIAKILTDNSVFR